MKTPKEFLFEHHSATEPKLDSIRQDVLRSEVLHASRITRHDASPTFGSMISTWYRELILPARGIWMGFAFIWLVIVAFNLTDSASQPERTLATAKTDSATAMMVWQEQLKLIAELTGPAESAEADKPKAVVPRPRSEWRATCFTV